MLGVSKGLWVCRNAGFIEYGQVRYASLLSPGYSVDRLGVYAYVRCMGYKLRWRPVAAPGRLRLSRVGGVGTLSPEEVARYFGVRLAELYRVAEWNRWPEWTHRMVDWVEVHHQALLYGEEPE